MAKKLSMQLVISAKNLTGKVFGSVLGGVKKLGVGALKVTAGLTAGAAGATAAFAALFSKMSDLIDEQAKVASSLGINNDALGVMRDAAGYAGVSNDALTTSLRKMSQGVADAANGTGEAQDALKALGLDAHKLQAMKPEDAFTAIITELDKIPNGIRKTSLAMDLFGRSGSAMANMTAKGLQQAQKDADALGLKLTTAQAAGVEAANDAWARIKNAGSDFLKYLTATLAPQVEAGFTKAFNFIKTLDLKMWAAKTALAIATAFKGALVVLGALGEAVVALTRGLSATFKYINQIAGGLGAIKVNELETRLGTIQKQIATAQANGGVLKTRGGFTGIDELRERETDLKAKLATYRAFTDSAVDLDSALSGASETLKSLQGFSQGGAVKGAVNGLEDMINGLNKQTAPQETTPAAGKQPPKETALPDLESLTAKAGQVNIAGIERLEIGGRDVLAELGDKASAEAAPQQQDSDINIKGVEKLEIGGVDVLAELKKQGDETAQATEKNMASMRQAIQSVSDGPMAGMVDVHVRVAEASKQSTDSQVNDMDRLIRKTNELRRAKIAAANAGGDGVSAVTTLETINTALETGAGL